MSRFKETADTRDLLYVQLFSRISVSPRIKAQIPNINWNNIWCFFPITILTQFHLFKKKYATVTAL